MKSTPGIRIERISFSSKHKPFVAKREREKERERERERERKTLTANKVSLRLSHILCRFFFSYNEIKLKIVFF